MRLDHAHVSVVVCPKFDTQHGMLSSMARSAQTVRFTSSLLPVEYKVSYNPLPYDHNNGK